MAEVAAAAELVVQAPVDTVRAAISDLAGRARWLPPEYSDVRAEGDGVLAYRLTVGRRVRDYRLAVTTAAACVTEQDQDSSLVNLWELTPEGQRTRVRLETRWQGAGGVGGFFERTFAPKVLSGLHERTLERLADKWR